MTIAWPWATPVDGQPWPGPAVDEMTQAVRQDRGGQALLDAAVLHLNATTAPADGSAVPNLGTGGAALDPAVSNGVRALVTTEADPDVFALHWNTDVTSSFSTPHAAGLVPGAEGVFIGARWRAVGDAEASGTEDGSEVLGKIRSLDDEVPGYDQVDYSLWIGLAAPFSVNAVAAIWTDTDDEQHTIAFDLDDQLVDPYELNGVGVWIRPDNGNDGHEVRLYGLEGGAWVLLASGVEAGTTSIRNEEGPLVAGAMSTLVDFAEVRDGGPTGDLMASFRPADADGFVPIGGTWTSAATGETWTAGAASCVLERTTGRAWLSGGSTLLTVADNALIDYGTDDWSFCWVVSPQRVADDDTEVFDFGAKQSGFVGAGGSGVRLVDLKLDSFGLDGFGMGVSDGANMAFALSNTGWTAGARHVVIVTMDRDGDLTVYVDGVARGSADMSSVGNLSTATGFVFGIVDVEPILLHAHAQWPRLLDATERAQVAARIGHP